jgi:predicted RNA-binding Zn-ribbon protein involved in translation (DUF1610 family)
MKTPDSLGAVIEEAARTADCPKCKGSAGLIVPLKKVDKRMAVYGCSACGFSFKADGGAFVKDAEQLRDVFRGATLADQTLTEALGGEKLNPATRAVLTAQLLEYGMQMYFDGLKQGLLLGTIRTEGKDGSSTRDGTGSSTHEKRAGRDPARPLATDEPRA